MKKRARKTQGILTRIKETVQDAIGKSVVMEKKVPDANTTDTVSVNAAYAILDDLGNIAGLATNIWRALQRIRGNHPESEIPAELRKVHRPLQSAIENMENMGIHIADYTGKKFVVGMALNVISSQPNPDLTEDRICEMLKPTVYYKEKLIQVGDVIVEGPLATIINKEENNDGTAHN